MLDRWFDIAVAIVIGALAFFGKRELSRIDGKADKAELDRIHDKADKAALTAVLVRLDTHIADDRALRAELTESLSAMNKTLTETQVAVARIAGRLDSQ